jgi:Tol biopolymer transport system component
MNSFRHSQFQIPNSEFRNLLVVSAADRLSRVYTAWPWFYLPNLESRDFWLVDLATSKTRQLTHLSDRGYLNTSDVTPDGKQLVFERPQQNSDVVLIDLSKK